MQQTCSESGLEFDIDSSDWAFYKKLDVPKPRLCPAERQRRRLSWRNERTLYKRKCSGNGRSIVGMYPSDTVFPVFDHSYFFSDNWNPLSYGRDVDFSRPFFEQFCDLQAVVPRIMNYSFGNENAEYGNLASWNKDCYMCFEADNNRDCLYCEYTFRCVDVVDSSYVSESELCYGCVDITHGYDLRYCLNCSNCSSSWFLKNCIGCSHCFSCVNLVKKQYCYFNQQLSKDEYLEKLSEINPSSRIAIQDSLEQFLNFAKLHPHKYLHGTQNEDISGDYLHNSKNAFFCFDSSQLRDCKYVCNSEKLKNAYDIDTYGGIEGAEKVYECHSVGRGAFCVLFGSNVYMDISDAFYCDSCAHVHNAFGCISLHHRDYCILNKQYEPEQYSTLRDRLIEHMRKTGEWGQFFPISLSPFAYNETMAHVHYPLTKEQVLARGWKWKEPAQSKVIDSAEFQDRVPGNISEVGDEILKRILICPHTGKRFSIQTRELELYRRLNLPLPILHPDQRFNQRMRTRNPRRIWRRSCSNCQCSLETSFSPDRPEPILCETCYQRAIA